MRITQHRVIGDIVEVIVIYDDEIPIRELKFSIDTVARGNPVTLQHKGTTFEQSVTEYPQA